MNQYGPPIVPGGRPQPPSTMPPHRQSWWARLNPAPKVFLILAGVAVGLCLAPTVLIAAVSQVADPASPQRAAPAVPSASPTATPSPRPSTTSAAPVPEPTTAPPAPKVTTTTRVPPPPPPEPEPQPQCHPSYEGACVPFASDVDCEGGSGNGPAYVRGPVTVVGPDVYGLDHDNDGVGCE